MHDLPALGFGPFFEQQLRAQLQIDRDRQLLIPARIAAEHRGLYEVWTAAGEGTARLTGRLRRESSHTESTDVGTPCTGDWVLLAEEPGPGRTVVIRRVLARRTAFTRGAAGRASREQVVAANVDVVFAVQGLDQDVSVHRVQRYVARIWASGAQPVVVLSKADLRVAEDLASCVAQVASECPGVPVHVVTIAQPESTEPLRALLTPGTTAALVGMSGAGKSTLVNAILGEERMRTGAVRPDDARGRHVTTHRQLVLLPGGGLLLDTPGMRELQLAGAEGLDAVFDDIGALAAQCRFKDCRHDTEPGCAVRTAVEDGTLDAGRFEHHRLLEREAEAFERRHDVRLRRQAERVWGQLHDEVVRLRKWKGGKR